jgi:Ricin-type beta-trefoil lectin domain-like
VKHKVAARIFSSFCALTDAVHQLSVSDMLQNGHHMLHKVVFRPDSAYTVQIETQTEPIERSASCSNKGENVVLLEGFLSGVVGNVLKEILTQAFAKKRKSISEKDVERIVATYLLQYHLSLQASHLGKEIYMFMGTSGLVSSGGQLLLPDSLGALEPTLQSVYEKWWDRATYKITSLVSEKVLDVSDWRTENGALIIQHECHGGTNQHWRLSRIN